MFLFTKEDVVKSVFFAITLWILPTLTYYASSLFKPFHKQRSFVIKKIYHPPLRPPSMFILRPITTQINYKYDLEFLMKTLRRMEPLEASVLEILV